MASACTDFEPFLPAYLDSELIGRDLHDVEDHITSCRDCAARLRAEIAFRQLVVAYAAPPAMPAWLRRRIAVALDAADDIARHGRWRRHH